MTLFLMLKFGEFTLQGGKPYWKAVIHTAENDLLQKGGAVVAWLGLLQ